MVQEFLKLWVGSQKMSGVKMLPVNKEVFKINIVICKDMV